VAISTDALPGRPLVVSRARTARRILLDRWASRLVVLGGIVIIASILAILLVILAEVWPLFRPPTAELVGPALAAAVPAAGESVGVDEYREIVYTITPEGVLQFTPLRVAGSYPPIAVPGLDGARLTAVAATGRGQYGLATSDGRVVPLTVRFQVDFQDGERVLTPQQEFGTASTLDSEGRRAILRLTGASPGAGPIVVGQVIEPEVSKMSRTLFLTWRSSTSSGSIPTFTAP
jgi:ABC-type uncharacterized transport system permease subunit